MRLRVADKIIMRRRAFLKSGAPDPYTKDQARRAHRVRGRSIRRTVDRLQKFWREMTS